MTLITKKPKQVGSAVLEKRSMRWFIQYIQKLDIPADLPYAQGSQAWGVCVMKQYNELDEPEWLKGCDHETHLMYWEQMGSLAKTISRVEMDLVIWSEEEQQFYVFPAKPSPVTPEQKKDGDPLSIAFRVVFPQKLEEPKAEV